jgi:hypothetical protein
MALLAESLVDEWLNRQGFFTIRGIRHGNDEIDLLGVRPGDAGLEAWHVEVQVSFRPIGYISPVTSDINKRFLATPRSAKKRPSHIVEECAIAWVNSKFKRDRKVVAREQAWARLAWKYFFVHGIVREEYELAVIERHGVTLVPFHDVLAQLKHSAAGGLRGGAGTDLSEIVEYFHSHNSLLSG